MLALFGPDARLTARLVAARPCAVPVRTFADWARFEVEAARCECAVVCIDWLADATQTRRLVAFRQRLPDVPVVLVTRRDVENARRLVDVRVDEVVWCEEGLEALRDAVQRARRVSGLQRAAADFERATHIAPPLRRALAHACRAAHPPHTLAELSRAAGCDRRTLWRHWRAAWAAAHRSPGCSLHEVLQWIELLRALEAWTPHASCRTLAESVGVHEHTLARAARALGGRGVCALAREGHAAVEARFAERVLVPLRNGPPSTASTLARR